MPKFLILFPQLLLLTCANISFAAVEYRGGAELLNAKAYAIIAQASIFSMTAHLDDTGAEISKLDGSSYQMIDTDFKISYGISSNLETSLIAKFRSVTSNDNINTVSNSGPESVGVLAKYAFAPINALIYAIELRYRQTLYTNTRYTNLQFPAADTVILGDDGSEYGVDFYATYLSNSWKLDFKLGYNSPPNDLSSEIVYGATALYKFSKLGILAGIEGVHSLKRDQFTDTPTLKPLMSRGQTYLFNSLNREKIAPLVGLNYSFDKFMIGFKAQTIISGKSTDKGNLLLASLSWNSGGVSADSIKIDSFKEYHIDGSVLKVSARGNFIKIDQGLSTDVEKGGKFDIYQTDYFGGNILVATGVVYEIGSDWSVIKLTKKYKEITILPGFAARGY
ncbi:MAG: hypothetical protein Q7U04_09020 [Bacteriovorax sp.]|nr:hypothetical protein [Bacteriovorax sp.]